VPELYDVMTIDDLAAYLKVPKSTLYKLVRGGQIPCQKVGRHWRFRRESINQWLDRSNARGSDGKTS
jgi:excisionase family DNA binding protein